MSIGVELKHLFLVRMKMFKHSKCQCLNILLRYGLCFMKYLGPFTIVSCDIGITILVYLIGIEQYIVSNHPIRNILLFILATWITLAAVMIIVSLFKTIHGDPGTVEYVLNSPEYNKPGTILTPGFLHTLKICKNCHQPKPLMAHHCYTCGKCVLMLDHHCPAIGKCVGLRNHRSFLVMLIWASLSTFTCSLTALVAISHMRFSYKSLLFILDGLFFVLFCVIFGFLADSLNNIGNGKTAYENMERHKSHRHRKPRFCRRRYWKKIHKAFGGKFINYLVPSVPEENGFELSYRTNFPNAFNDGFL